MTLPYQIKPVDLGVFYTLDKRHIATKKIVNLETYNKNKRVGTYISDWFSMKLIFKKLFI